MGSNPEVSQSFNTFHVCEAPVTIFFCLLLPVRPNGLTQGVPATANCNDGQLFLALVIFLVSLLSVCNSKSGSKAVGPPPSDFPCLQEALPMYSHHLLQTATASDLHQSCSMP